MKLYHGGPVFLHSPRMPMKGYRPSGHVNGILGIWCAVEKRIAERFAQGSGVVTEFGIRDDAKVMAMPVMTLVECSKLLYDQDDYLRIREEAIGRGNQLISLVEQDDTIGQYVIVDTSCIQYIADPVE